MAASAPARPASRGPGREAAAPAVGARAQEALPAAAARPTSRARRGLGRGASPRSWGPQPGDQEAPRGSAPPPPAIAPAAAASRRFPGGPGPAARAHRARSAPLPRSLARAAPAPPRRASNGLPPRGARPAVGASARRARPPRALRRPRGALRARASAALRLRACTAGLPPPPPSRATSAPPRLRGSRRGAARAAGHARRGALAREPGRCAQAPAAMRRLLAAARRCGGRPAAGWAAPLATLRGRGPAAPPSAEEAGADFEPRTTYARLAAAATAARRRPGSGGPAMCPGRPAPPPLPAAAPPLRLPLRPERVPSVTAVLQRTVPAERARLLERWRLRMARELGEEGFAAYTRDLFQQGKLFHAAVESLLFAKEIAAKEQEDDAGVSGYVRSVQHVIREVTGVRALESAVQHEALGYRGLVDCVAEYRGSLCLIDWKTSEKPKPFLHSTFDSPLQVVAYAGALNHDQNYNFQVNCGLVVIAYKDGSPAHSHYMDSALCDLYWDKWLLRLQEYWEKEKEAVPSKSFPEKEDP